MCVSVSTTVFALSCHAQPCHCPVLVHHSGSKKAAATAKPAGETNGNGHVRIWPSPGWRFAAYSRYQTQGYCSLLFYFFYFLCSVFAADGSPHRQRPRHNRKRPGAAMGSQMFWKRFILSLAVDWLSHFCLEVRGPLFCFKYPLPTNRWKFYLFIYPISENHSKFPFLLLIFFVYSKCVAIPSCSDTVLTVFLLLPNQTAIKSNIKNKRI